MRHAVRDTATVRGHPVTTRWRCRDKVDTTRSGYATIGACERRPSQRSVRSPCSWPPPLPAIQRRRSDSEYVRWQSAAGVQVNFRLCPECRSPSAPSAPVAASRLPGGPRRFPHTSTTPAVLRFALSAQLPERLRSWCYGAAGVRGGVSPSGHQPEKSRSAIQVRGRFTASLGLTSAAGGTSEFPMSEQLGARSTVAHTSPRVSRARNFWPVSATASSRRLRFGSGDTSADRAHPPRVSRAPAAR